MRYGSLFAGIDGLGLGLERAGMTCAWRVEVDEARAAVLRAHWPATPRFGDVATVAFENLEPVDLIAGGFPCQDISQAGRRAGLEGQQSGLWAHFARAVRTLRPRYVLVENVPSLLVRGLGTVAADLAASGYDAEWDCLPAAAFGAPHLRARVWLLAYPRGERDEADDTVFAGRSLPDVRPGWDPEPALARVADGASERLARAACRVAGDSVVPHVSEYIGRRLMEVAGGGGDQAA